MEDEPVDMVPIGTQLPSWVYVSIKNQGKVLIDEAQLRTLKELLGVVKVEVEEMKDVASGETQVVIDDTEGMNWIYYKAQSLLARIGAETGAENG